MPNRRPLNMVPIKTKTTGSIVSYCPWFMTDGACFVTTCAGEFPRA